MAKDTFFNLPNEKQEKIYEILRDIFENYPLADITISDIVKRLEIARGSFYQYFDDIYDCYFTLMEKETAEIHLSFFDILKNEKSLEASLKKYGDFLLENLYKENKRELYRYKFLNMDSKIDAYYQKKSAETFSKYAEISSMDRLKMSYIRSIVHGFIKKSLEDDYSKEKFTEIYKIYCTWILKGIENETNRNIF